MIFRSLAFFLFIICIFSGQAIMAATPTPQPGKPLQDAPVQPPMRTTAISIVSEGTDSLGARLSTRLKERFNQSSLFHLNGEEEKDAPELQLLITTVPEFPSRPGLGSIYSVCWVFRQSKGYLGYLLSREVGTFTADDIDGLIDKLVERTDGVAAKYATLWK